MYLLLVIVVWILFAYRFIDWANWRKHYPTVLFFIAINMTHNMIYFNHTLWAFRGITLEWLNHTIINLAFTFIIVPAGLFIFLQRFPRQRRNQFIYLAVWVVFYTALEWLFSLKGMYVYDNGWNNWYNFILNLVLFVILRMHDKNPVRAILVSIVLGILFVFMFPVPWESLK
ncbi:CBO0543 family protein [Sutcliffiella horikoshii]|uniref:CBO0543 family protein n=1 Tax=Sutcliffiella horikoshii TaxID=79883 RepID=UPI00384FE7B5